LGGTVSYCPTIGFCLPFWSNPAPDISFFFCQIFRVAKIVFKFYRTIRSLVLVHLFVKVFRAQCDSIIQQAHFKINHCDVCLQFFGKFTYLGKYIWRHNMHTPDKFEECQTKVIVLKFIEKNMVFPTFHRPQTSMWHIFNLCYTLETTRHSSVCTCPIWLKVVPNWSAIDRISKHELCDVMSVKLKINLKHTFFVHTGFTIVGRSFLFIINAWNFIYKFLIWPILLPANFIWIALSTYTKIVDCLSGNCKFSWQMEIWYIILPCPHWTNPPPLWRLLWTAP